jgi:hypothetical protein
MTTIKKYIRKPGTNEPRGIVVAVRVDDEVRYGYALLNTNSDKFDKKLGEKIAINRALSKGYKLPTVPEREDMVNEAIAHIEKRAVKYFKDLPSEKITLYPAVVQSPWCRED